MWKTPILAVGFLIVVVGVSIWTYMELNWSKKKKIFLSIKQHIICFVDLLFWILKTIPLYFFSRPDSKQKCKVIMILFPVMLAESDNKLM